MGEDYWAPVFARLLEDLDFLGQLCRNTADADLLNWVLPNKPLALKCARFIRRHKITDRNSLISEVMEFAADDMALRKIILFTWVEKNPKTMGFMSIPASPENIEKLIAGQFGKPVKIKILSRIDPRAGAEKIYQQYFMAHPELELQEAVVSAAKEAAPELEKKLKETAEIATKAVKRSRELESAIETVKTDNRQLKKDLENREKEVAALSRKLEETISQMRKADALAAELQNLNRNLELQLKIARDTTSKAPPASSPDTYSCNELQNICDNLKKQVEGLQKALQNRDNSIARLENEKAGLQQQIRSDDEQQRRLARLQATVKELEQEKTIAASLAAGQLITKVVASDGSTVWLFLSVTGQTFLISEAIVNSAKIINEEFALLHLNEKNEPLRLTSLEAENRREIFGWVKAEADGFRFVSDSDEQPAVCIEVSPQLLEKPVKAIYLPETSHREAGIYHLELLKVENQKDFVVQSAALKQLKDFFNADLLDFDLFCRELSKLKVSFKHEKEQRLKFSRDYRQVLSGLRASLPVASYCNLPLCIDRAQSTIMARKCRQGQACSFCGGFPTSEGCGQHFQFAGQRILILGGDRIGTEYERVLSRHNLLITWRSGFENLRDLRSGLGKIDAVVVVVRQISHTLLREIVPLAEKEKIPVIYSTRRGTSGVLSHLLDYFAVSLDEKANS